MIKTNINLTLVSALVTMVILSGCGENNNNIKNEQTEQGNHDDSMAGSDNNSQMEQGNNDNMSEGQGSNIPYLRDHHTNYSEHGSTITPAPTKDANDMSINWTIAAKSTSDAQILAEHINFMTGKLKNNENPRAWDELFLMEAYMKSNHYYTTSVEQSATNVIISKNANTLCAYQVISSHSDAVSGDFFGKGDIMVDYSPIAENILSSNACDNERQSIQSYISERKKTRGRR